MAKKNKIYFLILILLGICAGIWLIIARNSITGDTFTTAYQSTVYRYVFFSKPLFAFSISGLVCSILLKLMKISPSKKVMHISLILLLTLLICYIVIATGWYTSFLKSFDLRKNIFSVINSTIPFIFSGLLLSIICS